MPETIQVVLLGALGSLLAAALIILLGATSSTLRYFVFWRIRHYQLPFHRSTRCVHQWDVQWEDLRLTLHCKDVHNDHIEKLVVQRNTFAPAIELGDIAPDYKYTKIKDLPLELRVNGIVRTRVWQSDDSEKVVRTADTSQHTEYDIFLDVRRRRWWPG